MSNSCAVETVSFGPYEKQQNSLIGECHATSKWVSTGWQRWFSRHGVAPLQLNSQTSCFNPEQRNLSHRPGAEKRKTDSGGSERGVSVPCGLINETRTSEHRISFLKTWSFDLVKKGL